MTIPRKPLTHVKKQLTLNDRCDACQAQARHAIIVDNVVLLFCNHHYNKHDKALSSYTKIESIVEES